MNASSTPSCCSGSAACGLSSPTSSAPASGSSSACTSGFTARERRVLEALRPFLGADTEGLYAAHGRSLHRFLRFARDSSLPGCTQLLCGLRLARELLAKELRAGKAFRLLCGVSDTSSCTSRGRRTRASWSCSSMRGTCCWSLRTCFAGP